MSKKITGQQIAQKVYRDLEKLYGVKIEKDGVFYEDHLSVTLWQKVHNAVEAVKNNIETLPEPIRPVGRNAREKTWYEKPGPKKETSIFRRYSARHLTKS